MEASSPDILREKRNLRRVLKSRIGALSPETFHAEGVKAAAALQTLPLWHIYQTILVFFSMKDEIDTGPLITAAFAGGKAVFAPKIQGGRMGFWRVYSPQGSGGGGFGPLGIWEPEALPRGALGEGDFPALVITPGLGFDRQGGRLGRGGGYYDRFFAGDAASLPCFALGFCTAPQLIPRIPQGGKDKRMDGVCAGGGIWSCGGLPLEKSAYPAYF